LTRAIGDNGLMRRTGFMTCVRRPMPAARTGHGTAFLLRAAVVVLACVASACVSAQAKGDPGGPALAPPAPPPHTIIPVEIVEAPAAQPASPAPTPVIVRPMARPPASKPDKPVEKPVDKPDPAAAPPPAVAPAPTAPLLTTTNVTELERAIRARMALAGHDLERTDYRALNAERRTQYDTAKRFLQQADEALKVKNLVFAEQLADKAATLAAALTQK
jgi:outer membrane biosynthesis protein TonB